VSRALHEQVTMLENGEVTLREVAEHGPFSQAYLVGDPPLVAAKLERLLELYPGFTDVLCWTRVGGLEKEKVLSAIELFAGKVLCRARRGERAEGARLP
jgi:hypothetical protein